MLFYVDLQLYKKIFNFIININASKNENLFNKITDDNIKMFENTINNFIYDYKYDYFIKNKIINIFFDCLIENKYIPNEKFKKIIEYYKLKK